METTETIETLRFACRYPFSEAAKRVVKHAALPLNELPEELVEHATSRMRALATAQARALAGAGTSAAGMQAGRKQRLPELPNAPSVLRMEILSFPVAKMVVSAAGHEGLMHVFARAVADSAFKNLMDEKTENMLALADDFGLRYEMSQRKPYLVELPLTAYLAVRLERDFMRLVNCSVSNGSVMLSKNSLARLLSEFAYKRVRESVPVPQEKIPRNINAIGKEIAAGMRQRIADMPLLPSSISPECFPPCISGIYTAALSGKKLSHAERFNLATFLAAAGMRTEQIVAIFKNTPNFSEKITRYQVSRIAGGTVRKYSPASCAKMRSSSLCVADCGVRHPMQCYRRNSSRKELKSE